MMAILRHFRLNSVSIVCLLSSSLFLNACGFQLRGIQALPSNLSSINFQCANEKTWDLCRHLSKEFQVHQITLSEQAEMILVISSVNKQQRSLSINTDASTAEYDLIHSVHYQLIHSASQKQISSQRVEASQSYRHQASALIAKEREQDEIQTRLNQEIADIIFRQLSVFDTQRVKQALNSD
mgnify:CR=1 FL=1